MKNAQRNKVTAAEKQTWDNKNNHTKTAQNPEWNWFWLWSFPFSLLEKETGKLSQSIYSVTYFVEFVCLLRFIRLSPPVNAAVFALVCRGYQPASPIIQYTTVEMLPGSLWFHGLLKLEWLQASTESWFSSRLCWRSSWIFMPLQSD